VTRRPEDKTKAGGKAPEAPEAKERIYEAAVKLFARQGFAATGVRQLARQAGVNLATVNYFYGSKVGLLKVILEDLYSGHLAVIRSNLAGRDPVEVKLRRLVKALAGYMAANQEKVIIAVTELHHDAPEITEFKVSWIKRVAALAKAELVDPLQKATGLVFPLDILGPALAALAASRFLFRPVMENIPMSGFEKSAMDQYPDVIAEIYLNGVMGFVKSRLAQGEDNG